MDGVLWQLLASSRGAATRSRLVRELEERPKNANELAESLGVDYTTVRHHLDVLMEHDVLEPTGDGYGAVYVFTAEADAHWDVVEEILGTVPEEEA
ncbi:transcriptional regulator, ArsR family [Halomicrobium zhouii]|uniref:Transcriptional regulator, ArsR family n=1 Tax=Halomicrobium zhouii TaxID=767519 RepID=A0A1I6LUM7_9EURY|nr:winged helix-turn-helix domain-containing protein [Halomicrobium zhouii]SFS07139.1 transcriptional regulator, ArsR family [Halomicrobium zhouii]